MQCHKCPHYESIQRGDYTSKPWKETPCAKCKLGEDTFFSVPFDEENPDRAAGFQPALSSFSVAGGRDPGSAARCSLPDDTLLPASTFATCLQGLLTLDPELREIVALRFLGWSYREIAEQQGTSIQLAEMRHKRALRDWPALQALFPEKVAKQSRRRKSG
ncbi:sigma factor-like helix-turn-helix DNA-binding protein [Pontiellaceae bacterium B12227]|nr:sigma factor-like helix-turn-helix DNA-binding protein [Pontiellaceae bacterium B12227]